MHIWIYNSVSKLKILTTPVIRFTGQNIKEENNLELVKTPQSDSASKMYKDVVSDYEA